MTIAAHTECIIPRPNELVRYVNISRQPTSVVSNSSNEREGSDPEQDMGLQIVAMDMGTPQTDRMAKSATKLYPSSS